MTDRRDKSGPYRKGGLTYYLDGIKTIEETYPYGLKRTNPVYQPFEIANEAIERMMSVLI